MRHGDKIKNLGRTASHRRALLSNLTCQLIEHKRITTTLAKAKSLRQYAEPIINRSKEDSMHNRRIVFSYLQNKEAIKELFGVIGDKVASRPGGYTRIIKLAPRMGDAAEMALIELVDFNELYVKDSADANAKKTRRSRRGGGGAKKATVVEAATPGSVGVETEAPATTDTAEPTSSVEAGENDQLNPITEGNSAPSTEGETPAADGNSEEAAA